MFKRKSGYDKMLARAERNNKPIRHGLKKFTIFGGITFAAASIAPIALPAAPVAGGIGFLAGLFNRYDLERAARFITYPLRAKPEKNEYNDDREVSNWSDGLSVASIPVLAGVASLSLVSLPAVAVIATPTAWYLGGRAIGMTGRVVSEVAKTASEFSGVLKDAIKQKRLNSVYEVASFAPSVEPKTPTPQPAPKEGVSKIQRNVAQSRQKLAPDIAAGGTPTHQGVVAKSKPRRRLDSSIDTLDGFGVKKKTSDLTNSSTPSTDSKGSDEYLTVLLSIKERSLTEVQVEHTKIFNDNKEILVAYQSLTDTHYPQSFTEKEVALIKEKGGALTEQMRPLMIAANNIFTEIKDIKAQLDEVSQMESVQEVKPTITGSSDFASKATPAFEQADSNILSLAKKRAYLEQLKEQAQQIELDEQIQKLQEDIMFAGHSPVLPFAEAANDTVANLPQGDAGKAMAAATQNPKIKKWLNGSHQDPAKYQHCGL